ncbi:MAG: hypothetical protein ACI37Q_08280 [Candidatus Gastranaerophilaceae bacterium]
MGYLDGIGKNTTPVNGTGFNGGIKKVEIETPELVDVKATPPTQEFKQTDFGKDVAALTGKVRVNSPEGQGLPAATNVRSGELVSGYHFEGLKDVNPATFDLKYNTANVPQIKNGTDYACNIIEYTEVAGHLQSPDNPYAELFS